MNRVIEKLIAGGAWSRNEEQVQKEDDVDPEQIISCARRARVPRKRSMR